LGRAADEASRPEAALGHPMALETAIPDRKQLCDFIFLAGVQQSAASLLAAVKNSAGRAAQLTPLIRSVYPDKHPYTQQADQLARFCFPYGVLPSPRPQPICSFVTAVTLAGGTGDRLFLHVLVFPERYGTRLWVPACIACAGRVLLPRLFRPYLEQLQLRWAAFAALQAGLSEEKFSAQVAEDFASSWKAMSNMLALAPDIHLPPPGALTAFELGDTLFCFATPARATPRQLAALCLPTLPTPPPSCTHLELTRRLHVPLPPALAVRLLGLVLTGSQCLLFSRSATQLALTLEALLALLAPFEWHGAYMPLLPDAVMLESLSTRGPFIMGCLQHMRVGGRGEDTDIREAVSAKYAQRIQQSCYCFDLDQREEVGQCEEASLPMPPAMGAAIQAALATFEVEATAVAVEHQRALDFLRPETEALVNADPEDHEQLPPLEEAGTYDRALTFRPPRSASRSELERRPSRPPAAAIVAGVVRGKAELPYTPASEAAVPPPPTELTRLTEEQAAKRHDRANEVMAAHLKAATRWHAAETRLLGVVRAEIATLCPPEDPVADDEALEHAKAAVAKQLPPKTPSGFAHAVVHGLLGPTPWLRREEQGATAP